MDDYRFDALKNIEVPPAVLQSALNIPDQKPKKSKPFYLKPGVIAGTAAAVLMLVVGMTLFLNIFKNTPSVVNNITSTQTVIDENGKIKYYVDENGETVPQSSGRAGEINEKDHTFVSGNSASGSHGRTAETADGSTLRPRIYNSENSAPSAQDQTVPAETQGTAQEATGTATQPDITEPNTADVSDDTEPCAIPTESPGIPDETEPEIIPPTVLPSEFYTGSLGLLLPADFSDSKTVFCRLYDSGGGYIGGLTAKTVSMSGGMKTAVAVPIDNGIELTPGDYNVIFEDSNGNVLCKASFILAYWNMSSSFLFS